MELDNLAYSNLIFTIAENIEGIPTKPKLTFNLNKKFTFFFYF